MEFISFKRQIFLLILFVSFTLPAFGLSIPATYKDIPLCSPNIPAGTVCFMHDLTVINPTQFNYGQQYVNQWIYSHKKMGIEKYQKMLDEHLFSLIIGPDQKLYIPDGHHRITATKRLSEIQQHQYTIYFKVIKHFPTDVSATTFWSWMEKNHNVWLKDLGHNKPPQLLPNSVNHLTNDKYRSIAGWLEEARWCFDEENTLNYIEFYWADYFRNLAKAGKIKPYPDPDPTQAAGEKQIKAYMNYIKKTGICHEEAARHLPGYCSHNENCS